MALFCVEVGCRQAKNLCRMTASIIVPSETSANAIHYVEQHFPDVLKHSKVQRVCEVEHVVVDWPTGDVEIAEKDQPETHFLVF